MSINYKRLLHKIAWLENSPDALLFLKGHTSIIHSMLTTKLYKELLDVSDWSEKPHTRIFVLLLMSYIHDMMRCSYMLITAMTREGFIKWMVYLVCTTGSSNFFTECSQQPQLAHIIYECLEFMMLESKEAIGSMLNFTNSCFLLILMNSTFLPDFINETPNNYLRNVLLLLKQQELYLLTSTVSTGR